jgi:cytochrome c oxidase subunit 2
VVQRKRPPRLFYLLGTLLLGGCALDGPQSIFDTAGPIAEAQADLFIFIFWLGILVFVAVSAVLVYAVVKYRQRGDDDGSVPDQVHGVAWLEAIWTAAPAVILVLIGIPTVSLIFRTETQLEPTPEDLVVNVTGYQWWWEFEYPELGITTANELHIPTGRRVILNLNSGDVLHSFWVPRLAGKRDLIPNQDNQLWLIADEPGAYRGHCAELCLTAHAYMRLYTIAHSEEEFAEWVTSFQDAGQETAQPVALAQDTEPQDTELIETGKALFKTKGCANCHAIEGYAYGQEAPDLTNFGQRISIAAGVIENTPENLHAWLRNPDAIKPGNYMPALWPLPEEVGDPAQAAEIDAEIDALVAYLESLGTPLGAQDTRQAER